MSTYDTHADGAGCCYVSYRRPIVNTRPKYRISSMGITWQVPADLSIVGWLESQGYDYEVLTDEDLDRDGVEALRPYRCVLTGTQPRILLGADTGRDRGLSRRGRAGRLHGRQRLLLARRLPTRGPQLRRSASSTPGCGRGTRARASTTRRPTAGAAGFSVRSAGRRRNRSGSASSARASRSRSRTGGCPTAGTAR